MQLGAKMLDWQIVLLSILKNKKTKTKKIIIMCTSEDQG